MVKNGKNILKEENDMAFLLLGVVSIIISLFLTYLVVEEEAWGVLGFIFIIFSLGILSVLLGGYKCGYKNGNIDSINGIYKYEKIEQPNGEILWEEIEEE